MDALIIYASKNNLPSEVLKRSLKEQGIKYKEINIQNPEAITTIRNNGCLSMEPPVIQVIYGQMKMNFFKNDDLFWDGKLVRDAVIDLVKGPGSP
jgi:hypothetical protein